MTKKVLISVVFLGLIFLFTQEAKAFSIIDTLNITRQIPSPPPVPTPPTKPEPPSPPPVPTQSPWPSASPTPGPSPTPVSSPTATPKPTDPPSSNGGNNGGSSGGGGGVGGTSTGVLGASTLGDTGSQEDLLATVFIIGSFSLCLGMRKLYAFNKTS